MTHPERVEEINGDRLRDAVRGAYDGPVMYQAILPEFLISCADELDRLQKRASDAERTIAQCDVPDAVAEIDHLQSLLTASERRASETERTFADLRNLIAVNLAANAELVRERDEARAAYEALIPNDGAIYASVSRMDQIKSERDEAVRRAEEASAERTLILAALARANRRVIDVAAERDEARAALGKCEPLINAMDERRNLTNSVVEAKEAIRTALISYGE